MTRTSEFRSDVRTSRVKETFVFGAEPSRRLPVVHFGQSKARGLVKFQASVSKLRSPVTPASAHTIFVPGTPPPIVVCTHVCVCRQRSTGVCAAQSDDLLGELI